MPAITPEFKEAVFTALAQLGGEADTVQIEQKARAIAPEVDFGVKSGAVSCCLRRLETSGRVECLGRRAVSVGGPNGRDFSRMAWMIPGMTPKKKEAEVERLFFVRCTVGELRGNMNEVPEEINEREVAIFGGGAPWR